MADYANHMLNFILELIVAATWTDNHSPPKTRQEHFWLWVRRLIFLTMLSAVIYAVWCHL